MLPFTQVFFLVFALVTILGGIMGYVQARSTISLVAGVVLGVLLLVAWHLLHGVGGSFTAGEVLGLLLSLLLLGRFAPSLVRGKTNPAAYMVPLAVIGAVTTAMLLLGAAQYR